MHAPHDFFPNFTAGTAQSVVPNRRFTVHRLNCRNHSETRGQDTPNFYQMLIYSL